MDAKSARTLSLLTLKGKITKELDPVFNKIEELASEGLFYADFYYVEDIETYRLIRTHKDLLEKMGYTVLASSGRYNDMYQVSW